MSQSQLVGAWVTDETDEASIEEFGRVSLDFRSDGTLTYTIHSDDRDEKMLLTYKVRGNVIVTDQPSQPREEKTPFLFTPDGKLVLKYVDRQVRYVRTPPNTRDSTA